MEFSETEKNYKTDEKSLMEEIVITIKDYFACNIVRSGNSALLHFENGQLFRLSLENIN